MNECRFGIAAAICWGFQKLANNILLLAGTWLVAVLIFLAVYDFITVYPIYLYIKNLVTSEVSVILVLTLRLLSIIMFFEFFLLGFSKIFLELYDPGKSSIKTLFSQGHLLLRSCIADLLFLIIFALGLIFFVVPGLYFWCRFYFYKYAMVDKNIGVLESFRQSSFLTKGVRWKIFWLSIISIFLQIIPFLAVVACLAQVYAYKKQLLKYISCSMNS